MTSSRSSVMLIPGHDGVVVFGDEVGDDAVPFVRHPGAFEICPSAQLIAQLPLEPVDFAAVVDEVVRGNAPSVPIRTASEPPVHDRQATTTMRRAVAKSVLTMFVFTPAAYSITTPTRFIMRVAEVLILQVPLFLVVAPRSRVQRRSCDLFVPLTVDRPRQR